MKSRSILDRACEMSAIGIVVSCVLFFMAETFLGWLFLMISAPLYETSPRDPKAIDLFDTAAREEERPPEIDDPWLHIQPEWEHSSDQNSLDSLLPAERNTDPVTDDFKWVEGTIRNGK